MIVFSDKCCYRFRFYHYRKGDKTAVSEKAVFSWLALSEFDP